MASILSEIKPLEDYDLAREVLARKYGPELDKILMKGGLRTASVEPRYDGAKLSLLYRSNNGIDLNVVAFVDSDRKVEKPDEISYQRRIIIPEQGSDHFGLESDEMLIVSKIFPHLYEGAKLLGLNPRVDKDDHNFTHKHSLCFNGTFEREKADDVIGLLRTIDGLVDIHTGL